MWLLDSVVVCTLPRGNILLVYFLRKNPSCVNDVAFIVFIPCSTCSDDHDVRNQNGHCKNFLGYYSNQAFIFSIICVMRELVFNGCHFCFGYACCIGFLNAL